MQTEKQTYVLNDEKFKKVSKGLKRRIESMLDTGNTISIRKLQQALSQELFAMPYEEALATLLTSGAAMIDGTSKPDSVPLHKEIAIDWDGLEKHLYLRHFKPAFEELADKKLSLDEVETGLSCLVQFKLLERLFPTGLILEVGLIETGFDLVDTYSTDEFSIAHLVPNVQGAHSTWNRHRGPSSTGYIQLVSHYHQLNDLPPPTLQDFIDHLKSKQMATLVSNEDLPLEVRARMYTLFSSINYRFPSEQNPEPVQNPATEEQFAHITTDWYTALNKMQKALSFWDPIYGFDE